MRSVYLDSHSTTPVDPRVFEVMRPYFTEVFGNPASQSHRYGWAADEAVQTARRQVAGLIGAFPDEIVFTSGATESNNLALKGILNASPPRTRHLITVATEHRSVLDVGEVLQRQGHRLTVLPVDRNGLVTAGQVQSAITTDTALISVMLGNNEIGTLHPIREIGEVARARGIAFHCDGTQAAGLLTIDVQFDNIDLFSFSGHKLYGPKGVGALYVRGRGESTVPTPLIDGGGHERGLRSGTLNVPGIVGFGEACRLARMARPCEGERLLQLRNRLRDGLIAQLEGVRINGSETRRLPNNLSLSFQGIDGDRLLASLEDVAVSRGSACSAARRQASHVLRAVGLTDAEAQGTLRFGLGRFTTPEEIEFTLGRVVQAVQKLRTETSSETPSGQ